MKFRWQSACIFFLVWTVILFAGGCDDVIDAFQEGFEEGLEEGLSGSEEASEDDEASSGEAGGGESEETDVLIAEGTYYLDGVMKSQDEGFGGCMAVEIDDAGDLEISMFLLGGGQHSCTVQDTAEHEGDRYVYRSDFAEECVLTIEPTGDGVVVREPQSGLPCSRSYCGTRMGIREVIFEEEHRVDEIRACAVGMP